MKRHIKLFLFLAFLVLLVIIFGPGIDRWRSILHKKSSTEQENHDTKILLENIMTGPLQLLACKYEIQKDLLMQIIVEYEKLTGFPSASSLFLTGSKDLNFKNLVSVDSALDTISQKYQIDKKILSSIIIEFKMMEHPTPSESLKD